MSSDAQDQLPIATPHVQGRPRHLVLSAFILALLILLALAANALGTGNVLGQLFLPTADPAASAIDDFDADGVEDSTDNCPTEPNADQLDTDGDGDGDACDFDDDDDNWDDWTEESAVSDPRSASSTPESSTVDSGIFEPATTCSDGIDNDLDGLTDADDPGCGPDGDFDYVPDRNDNCPTAWNRDQADFDADRLGDACDDSDGDGVLDEDELRLGSDPSDPDSKPESQYYGPAGCSDGQDNDLDGLTDADDPGCKPDGDFDEVPDDVDNCPNDWNPDQRDSDADGVGDACQDSDSDGISDRLELTYGSDRNDPNSTPEHYFFEAATCTDETDNDLDGLVDLDDDGCAIDSDGDTIFNPVDNCPWKAEEGEITGAGWVQVFPSALTLETTSEYASGSATVSGTVYNVDLDGINSDEDGDLFEDYRGQKAPDYRGAPAPGRRVTAGVVEQSYRRIETGETYDFIAKIVRKTYRYDPVRTPIGDFSATSDGQGRFTISFPAGKDSYYEATLRVVDDAGRAYREQAFVYAGTFFTTPFGDSTYLTPDSERPYAIGDQVALTMRQADRDLPSGGDNRYLFYLAQNGIRSYDIQGGPRYSFAFADEHVPNVNVVGVRFTGGTYQEVGFAQTVRFDETQRQLAVSVKPGKERYRPGEKATLEVTVTDAAGRPVQAEVLLSAVDEAVFRLQGESFFYDLDILEALYQPVSSGILRSYASHQYPIDSSQGERGGGDGVRDNFKDVALFDRVTTDARGRASITFDLPDNLTSWRVTALAVSPDLYAGSSVSLVPVGLPFFVDATLNTSYLTSDRPSIKLRAFGDALNAGDPVSFEVTSSTLLDAPLTAEGAAFTAVDIPLPPLREGRHELTIAAAVPTAHGLEDSLVRVITVVPSRLLRNETRLYELQPGRSQTLEGSADRLTTVFITDHNRGRYYPMLRNLSWSYGDRVDQMLARNLSQELLATYFQEEPDFPAEFQPSLYQTPDGGIAIFPFADDDLVLSARLAALAPDRFGRQALAAYFQKILDDEEATRERAIIALYGLAALGEPVLPSVQTLAALDDLSVRERLYVGLAAAELGDQTTAGALYRGLLEEFGQRRGSSVRLNTGSDQDDILEATSLAAVLAASLGDDLAPSLFDYTGSNYTQDILVSLEQISYLVEALPRLSGEPVRFAYTVDGQSTEERLERGNSLALLLSPEELRDLNLEPIEGNLGVSTSFLAPFDAASVDTDPDVSLTRTYQGQTDATVTLHEGDLVRISLKRELGAEALDGCYQVSDLLPSGLRPVTRYYAWGIEDLNLAYPYFIEGQRVSFCVWKGDRQPTLVYYARVIATGQYTAEPAVIQSQKAPESINLTEPLQVEIR